MASEGLRDGRLFSYVEVVIVKCTICATNDIVIQAVRKLQNNLRGPRVLTPDYTKSWYTTALRYVCLYDT